MIRHKQIVVVDRCVLLKRPETLIDPSEGMIIPDVYIAEMIEGSRLDREPSAFFRWARSFSDRVYVGAYWWDLAAAENSCNRKVRTVDLVSWEMTRMLREGIGGDDPPDWEGRAHEIRSSWGDHGYVVGRSQFLRLASMFGDWIRNTSPSWWPALVCGTLRERTEARLSFIRQADLAADMAPTWLSWMNEDYARYKSDPWQKELTSFPDRCAVGRWGRLILWYLIKWAAGETSNFANHWSDIHYGLLASYTGQLATDDDGLAEAMHAVFPNCVVRSNPK